jgi:TRAP-type C4-dicarboxylate transport system substrate-binding protein
VPGPESSPTKPTHRTAFIEAARLGGIASRKFAAEAEATGVALLQVKGMEVVRSIENAAFVQAMGAVMPQFQEQFGEAG